MRFIEPDRADIQKALPQIRDIALIDQGGFKAVYRASIGGKIEALKLIAIQVDDWDEDAELLRQEMLGRVQREVAALARCAGPEIVKLGSLQPMRIKIGTRDSFAYTEEFLPGKDLWKLIRAGGPQPAEGELRLLFVTLLKAIRELWGHGYVHRDIKPCNVMRLDDDTRRFVLLDLGIAFAVRETPLTANPSQRMPIATYRYLAPEMMNPAFRDTIDYRSDLYTAAMTVYEYAAQRHPLAKDNDDKMATISRALRQPAKPLANHRQDLPPEFCKVIDQMLKKKPMLRPHNFDSLINRWE